MSCGYVTNVMSRRCVQGGINDSLRRQPESPGPGWRLHLPATACAAGQAAGQAGRDRRTRRVGGAIGRAGRCVGWHRERTGSADRPARPGEARGQVAGRDRPDGPSARRADLCRRTWLYMTWNLSRSGSLRLTTSVAVMRSRAGPSRSQAVASAPVAFANTTPQPQAPDLSG
jgi:hypothetical protein